MHTRSGSQDRESPVPPTSFSQTIGVYLREKRLQHAIGLEEVSYATGISKKILQALENEDRDQLPADVYVKAFYKKYAKFLGIKSEDVDAKYYRHDQGRKKIGSRYHFSTVVTLKGREENIFFDILRRLFLPLSLLVLGVLIYWLYSKYLGSADEIGFSQLQFPPEGPSVPKEPFDMFS